MTSNYMIKYTDHEFEAFDPNIKISKKRRKQREGRGADDGYKIAYGQNPCEPYPHQAGGGGVIGERAGRREGYALRVVQGDR